MKATSIKYFKIKYIITVVIIQSLDLCDKIYVNKKYRKLTLFLESVKIIIMSLTRQPEHESVTLFREYLQIPSVQPNVNYSMYFPNLFMFVNLVCINNLQRACV